MRKLGGGRMRKFKDLIIGKLLLSVFISFLIGTSVRSETYLNLIEVDNTTYEGLTVVNPVKKGKIIGSKCSLSIGSGMYKDLYLGAAGILIRPLDNLTFHSGVAYLGEGDWAGYAGLTFELGKPKKLKKAP